MYVYNGENSPKMVGELRSHVAHGTPINKYRNKEGCVKNY